MPPNKPAAVNSVLLKTRQFLESQPLGAGAPPPLQRLRTAGHFLNLVVRGFLANRCAVRAAALSYTTLLALVPLLAVVLSVSKNFLHAASADVVPKMLNKAVEMVAPQLEVMSVGDATAPTRVEGHVVVSTQAREQVVEQIQSFIGNIDAGALGVVGTIFLIVVAIRLLVTIEDTFNDIWGVQEGRSVWRKVVYYWTTITLGPLLLLGATAATGTAEFATLTGNLNFVLQLAPFLVLWIGFTLMYALMPNTRVGIGAAFAGGLVGGTLWQLNNLLNTLYVSRVISYSKMYGAIGIFPVLLVGLYFSWLIVLFGAQVSFAVQNIRSYLQQRVSETFDQEGRELLACRIVLQACHSFLRGRPSPNAGQTAERLHAPLQLVNQLVHRLTEGHVLCTVAEDKGGLRPARPPDAITLADVLHVMRTHNGHCGDLPRADGGELVNHFLTEVYAAERAAPANVRFSDLAAKLDGAA